MTVQSATVVTAACAYCGVELHGAYCHACGQKHRSRVPQLAELASDIVSEGVQVGGRLLATLRLLILRPGRLTLRYFDERGFGTYWNPVRLFLFSSLLAFLASRVSRGFLFLFSLFSISEGVGEEWAAWIILATAIPLSASLLQIFFWTRRRHYLEHLVFVMHVASFVLLLSAADSALGAIAGTFTTANWMYGACAAAVAVVYATVALRVFYAESWWKVIPKAAALLILYLVALGTAVGLRIDWTT